MIQRLLTIPLLLSSFVLPAQNDVKDRVAQALRTGNARELAQQFIANVDLTVPGTSDIFSKAQAEQILRKFFDEHEPRELTLEHEGVSKMGDRYYIGRMKTTKGEFRVTFFLKRNGDVFQVKQLRIETGKGDL
ncbi:MAG: DUF4783 domain-containing protein [Flavobacteriales bacterium]|nr:DUF4783 domain-containing protein [Flavobacteriales bacterium]